MGVVLIPLLLNVDLGSLLPWIKDVLHRVIPFVVVCKVGAAIGVGCYYAAMFSALVLIGFFSR